MMTKYNNYKNTIFSQKSSMTMDTWKSGINNNVVVVGSSGSGKTRGFVKPNLFQKNASYIISDPKGTLIRECGEILASKQDEKDEEYTIKVLNLIDLSKSMHYNPLAYIKSEDDIYSLVEFVIANNSNGTRVTVDSFWHEMSSLLLTSLIGIVHYAFPSEEKNFNTVLKLLNMAKASEDFEEEDDLDLLFSAREKQSGECFEVRFYNKYKVVKDKTKSSVLATLCSILAPWELSSVKELIQYDELELDKLGERYTALFVMISDVDDSKNFLAGILYSQLFKLLCNQADNNVDGKLNIHTRFFLDDFACVGKIPQFERLIASIRSREISACIILQNESQLESRYGDMAPNIIGNCDTYLFMGSNDINTCRRIAERLGKKTKEVLQIPVQKCYIFSGQNIIYDNKFSLEQHKRFSKGKKFDYRYLLNSNLPTYVVGEEGNGMFNIQEIKHMLSNEETQTREKTNIEEENREDITQDIDMLLSEIEDVLKEFGAPVEKISRERGNELRKSFFDSLEEEQFYQQLLELLEEHHFSDLQIDTHVHLNEIFSNPTSVLERNKYRYRLVNQHCDFVIRNKYNLSVIAGVEIDGSQHLISQEQRENDEYKNKTFENNQIPLLRISTADVRSGLQWQEKILHIINKAKRI